jgi:hypothetical protein
VTASGPVVVLEQPLACPVRVLDIGSRPDERAAQFVLEFCGRHQMFPFMLAERWVRVAGGEL